MRIVRCHIEGFGMLVNQTLDFDGKITCILKDNGGGKSTLAAFIRAMLYGMKTSRSTDREMSDREKYYPISGAVFGGSLTVAGKDFEYVIERRFDKKSEKKDILEVYDGSGHRQNIEAVGEKIFGLNADSFMRTAFFSLGDTSTEVGGDISEKLSPLKIGRVSAEDAIDKLEEIKKKYRHKGRRGGAIFENDMRKYDCLLRKKELDGVNDKLLACKAQLEEKRKTLTELEQTDKRQREAALVAERQKNYKKLLSDIGELDEKRKTLVKKYPSGIPSKEKCEEIAELDREISRLDGEVKSAPLDEKRAERLSVLSARFADGIPSDSELSDAKGLAKKHGEYRVRLMPTEKSAELSRLEKRFSVNEPSDSLIERVRALASEAAPTQTKKKTAPYAAAAGLLAAVISVGVALVGVNLYAAIAVIVLGFIGEMANGFIYLLRRTAMATALPNAELLPLIAPYGYNMDEAQLFLSDTERYRTLVFEYNEKENSRAEDEKNAAEIAKRLDTLFEKYRTEYENYIDGTYALSSAVKEYRTLENDKRAADEKCECLRAELAERKDTLSKILSEFSLTQADSIGALLVTLNTDRAQLLSYDSSISELTDRKERERPSEESVEPLTESEKAALGEEISNLRREITDLSTDVSKYEDKLAERVELDEKIARLDEENKEMERKYRIAELACTLIEGVDRRMKEEYSAPMNKSFLHYAESLEDKLNGARLDERLSLTYDEDGTLHRFDHLSSGEMTLASICMRLALIDNIYEKERPFLILDDPFAELDATHLDKAKRLLSDISKSTQIIYFTCHESRRLG